MQHSANNSAYPERTHFSTHTKITLGIVSKRKTNHNVHSSH